MDQVPRPRVTMESAAQKDCCCEASTDNPNPATQLPRGASGQTRDPVCGMVVAPSSAKSRAEHDGHTYYFCCGGCNAKFVADPDQYVNPTPRPASIVPSAPSARIAVSGQSDRFGAHR
jgi:YHS domain-containing protein